MVEANVEEPDSRDLRRWLCLGGERHKREAKNENDREPDQSHTAPRWRTDPGQSSRTPRCAPGRRRTSTSSRRRSPTPVRQGLTGDEQSPHPRCRTIRVTRTCWPTSLHVGRFQESGILSPAAPMPVFPPLAPWIWPPYTPQRFVRRILPVTFMSGGCSSAPSNFTPKLWVDVSTPSKRRRKSMCHQSRRNSPSVTDCRPTDS